MTAISAGTADHLHVMTANAVTSLSLDPLMILFCVDKQARLVEHLERQQRFCINILRREQEDLSNHFAGLWKGEEPPHFEFTDWQGFSLLVGSAAALGCELHEMLEGGDHWIVLGRVMALYQDYGEVNPLIFFNGRYRTLAGGDQTDV